MSMLPMSEVQAALYTALTGDGLLMAMVTGVYDHVPPQAAFPYIVFEEASVSPWGLLRVHAHGCVFQLDIYSRKGGQKEVMQIAARLHALLHGAALTVSGWDVAPLEVGTASTDRQADGLTSKVNLQVRVWLTEV